MNLGFGRREGLSHPEPPKFSERVHPLENVWNRAWLALRTDQFTLSFVAHGESPELCQGSVEFPPRVAACPASEHGEVGRRGADGLFRANAASRSGDSVELMPWGRIRRLDQRGSECSGGLVYRWGPLSRPSGARTSGGETASLELCVEIASTSEFCLKLQLLNKQEIIRLDLAAKTNISTR